MVVVGNFRNRAELRRKPRRQFQYPGRIFIDKQTPRIECTIADVSDLDARLMLESEHELPDKFILLLAERDSVKRYCKLVWRNKAIVGVEFRRPSAS